jgi:hypothetical protein
MNRFAFCLTMLLLAMHSLRAMPSDYIDQVTPLVSAEELNLLYGSIPHKSKRDVFTIHASHRENYATKYFILSKPHAHTGDKRIYMIVGTSPRGCEIYYEGEDIPFADKSAPLLERSLPMDALWDIYMASQMADFSLPETVPQETGDENASADLPAGDRNATGADHSPTLSGDVETLIDQIVEGVGAEQEKLAGDAKDMESVAERQDVTLVGRVNLPILPRSGYWTLVHSYNSPGHATERWRWAGTVSMISAESTDNGPDLVVDVDFHLQKPPPSAESIARGYTRASRMYSYAGEIDYHTLDDGAEWVEFKTESSQGVKKILEAEDGYVMLTLEYPPTMANMSEDDQDQLEQMTHSIKEATVK